MRRRSPRGERGLKYAALWFKNPDAVSLPSRGAWIEISVYQQGQGAADASLPSRGAWIEMVSIRLRVAVVCGRSPRGERGLK